MTTWFKLFVFLLNIPYLVMGMNCYICSRTVECRNRSYKDALESIQREEYIEGGNDAPMRRTEVIGNHNKYDLSDINLILVRDHYMHRSKRQSGNVSMPTAMTTTTVNDGDLISSNIVEIAFYQFGIIAGTGFLGALFLTDTLPSYPLPGEVGGGFSPTGVLNEQQRQALSLTPPNRKPLAVFPPFSTPRTFPARAVIFREKAGLDNQNENPASFPSIQWLRENFAIFRRRSPKLFKCINLDTDLVGFRIQYNYTCFENSINDCKATNLLNGSETIFDNILRDRQSGEDFCSSIENECRLFSMGGRVQDCTNAL